MEVIINKSFIKDLSHLPITTFRDVETLIDVLKSSDSLQSSGLEYTKMTGQKKNENRFYRIRIGMYRIGVEYITPKIILLIIAKRESIYKYFPPK